MSPEDRPFDFIPKQFSSMREVAAYGNFVKERFERCLDLYLCPRTKRTRLNIDPEALIPKLPKPRELRPFPTEMSVEFKVRTLPRACVSGRQVRGCVGLFERPVYASRAIRSESARSQSTRAGSGWCPAPTTSLYGCGRWKLVRRPV
jgi:hypothetical protein